MSKLEHLIYTELRNGIGVSLDGKTQPKAGYGVFSMSKGLGPSGLFRDREYLGSEVNLTNGSRPAKDLLIHSFAYAIPAGGIPMLGYYYQRDGRTTPNDRLASAYVDEWYFGSLDCYPMDLFEADIWKAHKKSHQWYASEAPVPTPYLEQVDTAAITPCSLREKAIRFARDGRQALVRKAVWMVLKQMSLPASERKYLIIRDTEENVRLWIAAILYQLPLRVALQIGFKTNATGVNNPQYNVYQFNRSACTTVKTMAQVAPDGTALERHFHAMIVGVHPQDTTLPAGVAVQDNRTYMVLDGTNNTCFPAPEEELNREYFRCMVDKDSAITNFFMDMEEMVDLEPTLELLDLFDAHSVLQTREKWNYQSLVRALNIMTPHFSNAGHAVLLNYVLKYLCSPEGYETRYIAEDAQKQLTLMRLLRKCAAIVNKTSAIVSLERAAYSHLKRLVSDPFAGDALRQFCTNLDAVENGMSTKLMKDLFGAGLRFLDPVDFSRAPDTYMEQLCKLIHGHITSEHKTWGQLWADPMCKNALDRFAAQMCKSEALTDLFVPMIKGDRDCVDRLLQIGANNTRWLARLIPNLFALDYVCAQLAHSNPDASAIENLLCCLMERSGPGLDLQDAYDRHLASKPNAGDKFYDAWLNYLSRLKSNPNQYIAKLNELVSFAASNPFDSKRVTGILQQLDASVTFEITEYNRKMVELLEKWHPKCRFSANNAECWSFLDMILENSLKNRKHTMYERCILRNPECDKFHVSLNFVRSPMCEKLMETALKDADKPEVHALVLLMFNFREKADLTEYVDMWIERVCNASVKSKGKDVSLATLYGLYNRCFGGDSLNRECELILDKSSIKERQMALDTAIRGASRYLCEIRTDKASEAIVATVQDNYGNKAAVGLRKLFDDAQKSYRSTHKGFFGNMGRHFSNFFGNYQDED